MAAGFPYFHSDVSVESEAIRRCWGWLFVWGILLLVAGTAAVLFPVLGTVFAIELLGFLFLLAAGGHLVAAFQARGWGGVLITLLCGIMYLFSGIVLLERPLLGAAAFVLFLAMMFFAVGVARMTAAIVHRFTGWGWAALSGFVSILLAVMIWRGFPDTALWLIGTFVGIDLIFAGWSWIMLGLAARQLPTAPA